ncbi:MAG: Nif3-like dinuclear metal center hexameric protein [Candidatus Margulisbacteria bacterium]|nr:Nif3-like dinuclear metal center hexameric protein [Candidatus Margulisiibacteriota bacterium]
MLISEITQFFENLYPLKYSLSWDNCGLQTGSLYKPVSNVLITLTPTTESIKNAIENHCELMICHHPLIFKSLASINTSEVNGQLIEKLIKANITLYAMHTNLDIARNGISDVLANYFDLNNIQVLNITNHEKIYKIIVYVPAAQFSNYREKLLDSPVGNIGNYSHCSFSSEGEGTFKPGLTSKPFIGQAGELSKVKEYKLETVVLGKDLEKVIEQIVRLHPYEEPAYDVILLHNNCSQVGLGRYGSIEPVKLQEFNQKIVGTYKGYINMDRIIKTIAVCGGNGSDLVQKAVDCNVDLFISGDIDYHADLLARESGLTIFDIGHENSEKVILPYLHDLLSKKFGEQLNKISIY